MDVNPGPKNLRKIINANHHFEGQKNVAKSIAEEVVVSEAGRDKIVYPLYT
jgi:hypothetical protein